MQNNTSQQPLGRLDRLANSLLKGITRSCDAIGIALLAATLLLITSSVLIRDLIGAGVPWVEEVTSLMMIYAVGFGALSAWVRGEHLVVDLLSHRISHLARRLQYRIVAAASMVFFAMAAYGSVTMAIVSANNRTVSLGISFSVLYTGIAIGFVGMGIIALYQTFRGYVEWSPVDQDPEEAN